MKHPSACILSSTAHTNMCGKPTDERSSVEDYQADKVYMPIGNTVYRIDSCIHDIVAALNAGGVPTRASCCGHGKQPGNILLEDGRVINIIFPK